VPTAFHYGPYRYFSTYGMVPGEEHYWTFGPWAWETTAVVVSAHPDYLPLAYTDGLVAVTSISSHIAPLSAERTLQCTVRNVGKDNTNYTIYLGGVIP
jgi:hypothetical protein